MTTLTPEPATHAAEVLPAEVSRLLADSYALYLKSQGYHWNVIGPDFRSLHRMFEEQYAELSSAIDEIAERVRALGAFAPGSLRAMSRLASVPDEDGAPDATEMLNRLIEGHEVVLTTAKAVLDIAEAAGDAATADLATGRIAVHEKTLWMLRATVA